MTVHDDAPADDDDPAGQGVHSAAPNMAAYVPAEHGWQVGFPSMFLMM